MVNAMEDVMSEKTKVYISYGGDPKNIKQVGKLLGVAWQSLESYTVLLWALNDKGTWQEMEFKAYAVGKGKHACVERYAKKFFKEAGLGEVRYIRVRFD